MPALVFAGFRTEGRVCWCCSEEDAHDSAASGTKTLPEMSVCSSHIHNYALNANAAQGGSVLGVFLPPPVTAGMDSSTLCGNHWELAVENERRCFIRLKINHQFTSSTQRTSQRGAPALAFTGDVFHVPLNTLTNHVRAWFPQPGLFFLDAFQEIKYI